ncbi:MAG: substrate-binding domain-containing protein [Scytonema sp. PMC 1069.18]|nr:substrate-binding domain-containing protein [Scytonema sp. PMC 1069.18]MEC4887654.1 substrate-binding domain-containing protein [Scytonema sp. PMC 1070.18]
MNLRKQRNQKVIVCTHCDYDANPVTATNCQKCGEPLNVAQKSNRVNQPKPKSWEDWLLTPWTIRLSLGLLFLFLSWLIYCLFVTVNNLDNAEDVASSGDNIENSIFDVKLYDSMKDVPNVPEGTFNYGGGTSIAALTAAGLHESMTKAHPNFNLRYTEPTDNKPGGRKGIDMLLNRQLSLTLYGGVLENDSYSTAKERGFQLKQVPVALDALVFFTHPDISISGLSVNQLRDVYKGKLTNWKQVGGPDLPIVPITRNPNDSNLLHELLGQEVNQVSPRVQFIRNTTEALRKVSSTPGGISFGGNTLIIGQQTVRPLAIAKVNSQEYVQPVIENGTRMNTTAIRNSSYPLTRRRFIVYRLDGTIDQLAGDAYVNMLLSKEGQQIVEKAGFIPVR